MVQEKISFIIEVDNSDRTSCSDNCPNLSEALRRDEFESRGCMLFAERLRHNSLYLAELRWKRCDRCREKTGEK